MKLTKRSGKDASHEIKLGRLAVLLLVDVLEVASRDYGEGAKHDKREQPGSWEQISRHRLCRELVEPPFFVLDDPEERRRPFLILIETSSLLKTITFCP